jgi:hypothetical protein
MYVRYVRIIAHVRDLRCRWYRRYRITRLKWFVSGSIEVKSPSIPPIVLRIPFFFIRISWRQLIPSVHIRLMMLSSVHILFLEPKRG